MTDGPPTPERSPAARLIVLSGPSGVGKSTLLNALRTLAPELWISISVTTRHPRPGERHGVEYYFVDSDTFATMVRDGDLLEWAEFADNHYGTPREPVLDRLAAGSPVLLELEIQGARQIRTSLPEALLVFLTPPSWEELVRRLTGRGTEAQEVIDSRLRVAREELAAEPEFDVTLVNTSVEEVVGKLLALTNG